MDDDMVSAYAELYREHASLIETCRGLLAAVERVDAASVMWHVGQLREWCGMPDERSLIDGSNPG